MEEFSYSRQLAKVTAGFKGGPFFRSPNLAPKLTFAPGYPAETNAQFGHQSVSKGTPIDVYHSRKGK